MTRILGIRLWILTAAVAASIGIATAFVAYNPQSAVAPEPIAWGRDTCARCRMHLSRPGFAAEAVIEGHLAKYDDLGCLLAALRENRALSLVWVEDHDARGWVRILDASLVRSARIETPMGSGIVAFADEARARAFAGEQQGELVTLAALLDESGQAPAHEAEAGGPRPLGEADAAAGKAIYLRECSACHGEHGRGDGPAAAFVEPKPRDFTKQPFKLRTTPDGAPPATADVLRVIEHGIPGTAMPPFRFLSAAERRGVAAFVLARADLLDGKEPERLPDPGQPPPVSPELLARGATTYQNLGCHLCHGQSGKGDGSAAKDLRDGDGRPIAVRDFTTGVYRGGDSPRDLYYRFAGGMSGTPMPAFGSNVKPEDTWALVHFVRSLEAKPAEPALPDDPIAAGRRVADKYACRGCHVLDDGVGGAVGPDLRVSGQKLDSEWLHAFLEHPRAVGTIYPWRPWRMPELALSAAEIDVMVRYLAAMGGRKVGPVVRPEPELLAAANLTEGKNIFLLRCTECHTLGTVIETPLVKQQGPDLIRVADRVDYAWAKRWILDPRGIDPHTRMTVPGITPEQADSVRAFVWKTALQQASGFRLQASAREDPDAR